jgi:hypothetical protein
MTSAPTTGPIVPVFDRADVALAVERFERESGLRSSEFVSRYLDGEFGRAAWARTWYQLLA